MSKNTCDHRDFLPLYKALHKNRFSSNKSFTCSCGKEIEYEFFGSEEVKNNLFLRLFSWFLWMTPAIATIIIAALMGFQCPIVFLYALIFVIVYHFAGMYYIVTSPTLVLKEKKKGFFRGK